MCKSLQTYQYGFDKANIDLKTVKLLPISIEGDYNQYQRVFTGRMTKARWEIIHRFCRMHTFNPEYRCGHEWDCCGCFCGQRMSFKYSRNQTVITFTQSFNY